MQLLFELSWIMIYTVVGLALFAVYRFYRDSTVNKSISVLCNYFSNKRHRVTDMKVKQEILYCRSQPQVWSIPCEISLQSPRHMCQQWCRPIVSKGRTSIKWIEWRVAEMRLFEFFSKWPPAAILDLNQPDVLLIGVMRNTESLNGAL